MARRRGWPVSRRPSRCASAFAVGVATDESFRLAASEWVRVSIAQVAAHEREEFEVHPKMMERLAKQLINERATGVWLDGVARQCWRRNDDVGASRARGSELWARLIPARRSGPECLAITSDWKTAQ